MLNTFVNITKSIGRKNYEKYTGVYYIRQLSSANVNHGDILKIPECPKSSFFDAIVSLVCFNKAMKLHEIVDEKHKKMGTIYKDHLGPVTAIFVNSPEDFRKIFRFEGTTPKHFLPESWIAYNEMRQRPRGLLFMDGEEWLHYRRIMNKLLLMPNRASNVILESCQKAALTLTEQWAQCVDNGGMVDGLERRLYQWSIETMLATLLGSAWDHYKEHIANDESKKLARTLHRIFELTGRLSLFPVKYAITLRLPLWREFVQVTDNALDTLHQMVPEMTRLQGNGLLSLMQEADIQDHDLSRIVTDLIIAAGDTTAYSTQWALFLLARHPHVQEKLAEIVRHSMPNEVINHPYVKGVIKESLRLYPTAPFLTRILPKDSLISGYQVSAGELIVMSLYSSGRDPKNFIEPDEFRPERWIRNKDGNYDSVLNASASIPFALGARNCVGKKLAMTQMILTISELTKNFRIECRNAEKIKMILHMIAVPSESIELKLLPRKKI